MSAYGQSMTSPRYLVGVRTELVRLPDGGRASSVVGHAVADGEAIAGDSASRSLCGRQVTVREPAAEYSPLPSLDYGSCPGYETTVARQMR